MGVTIHPITLGVDHCYLIRGEKIIMIDGGAPKQGKRFMKAIERLSIKPEEIKLIVLTHGHWDHIGSAKEIKDLTGAKLALHRQEKDWLEKSLKPLPPGVTAWGNLFVKTMAIFMPLVHIPATDVDIALGDGEFPLFEYGIPGRIVHTPGHSMGSVSVLLETGDAFVGDSAMRMFPLRLTPGLPILAEDMRKLKESWKLLMEMGAKTIYPAHGKPFSVDFIREALLCRDANNRERPPNAPFAADIPQKKRWL
jgi:glyoxylase-like metal-dependent hydrolase (beta-lactamase superfamily II)